MGYSVTALASEIGYSHTYVSRVEGGQIPASARYRKAVSKALRVPEAMIFGLPAGEEP
jgi:transcriptional regulator with XRE-family HTH domain